MDPLGKQGYGVLEPSSYTAWVILPPNIDRIAYVNKCLQTGTVLIKSVDGQIETYVQIDKTSIHYIRFPIVGTDKGSAVICVKDPIYRTSKIVAVLQDEDDEQTIFEENQWKIHKRNKDNFVDIDAKGNSGELDITVDSTGNDNVESNFKFLNKSNKAKVKWLVQGTLILESDDSIQILSEKKVQMLIKDSSDDSNKEATITYEYGKGFTLLDEFENTITTKENKIQIITKNGETFVLDKSGLTLKTPKEDLKTLLSDSIDVLISSIVLTPVGPANFNPGTITQLNALKARLNNLFS